MGKPNAVAILGGGLTRDAVGKWHTTTFDDVGDNFGIIGDRLRVMAAYYLYQDNPQRLIIASGGKGQLQNIPDAPSVSEIIKNELVELGVPEAAIILEDHSRNTYQQLRALPEIMKEHDIERVSIVSNEWHLPRIRAMLEYHPVLKEFLPLTTVELIPAEKVVITHAAEFESNIIKASKSEGMKERIEREQKGVKEIMNGTYQYGPVVRKATIQDSIRIYEIRNHELVRKNSLNPKIIDFDDHDKWFRNAYFKNENICFVMEIENRVIGYCRFDRPGDAFRVSMAIDAEFHGKGLGTIFLQEGLTRMGDHHAFTAEIKMGNIPSLRLFQKNGFITYKTDDTTAYLIRRQ